MFEQMVRPNLFVIEILTYGTIYTCFSAQQYLCCKLFKNFLSTCHIHNGFLSVFMIKYILWLVGTSSDTKVFKSYSESFK